MDLNGPTVKPVEVRKAPPHSTDPEHNEQNKTLIEATQVLRDIRNHTDSVRIQMPRRREEGKIDELALPKEILQLLRSEGCAICGTGRSQLSTQLRMTGQGPAALSQGNCDGRKQSSITNW